MARQNINIFISSIQWETSEDSYCVIQKRKSAKSEPIRTNMLPEKLSEYSLTLGKELQVFIFHSLRQRKFWWNNEEKPPEFSMQTLVMATLFKSIRSFFNLLY